MKEVLKRVSPGILGPLTSGAGACAAGGCAGVPILTASPVATALLGGTVGLVHIASGLLLAPVTLLLLIRTCLRHRRIAGVLLAGAGVLLMLAHYASHFVGGTLGDEPFMYAGAALLLGGALFDLWAQRAGRLTAPRLTRATLAVLVVMLIPFGLGGLALGQIPSATAILRDANGQAVGRATLTQSLPAGGVWIQVVASGLTPGVHGIHVHAVGACTGPAFLSAGGHFNPEGLRHGLAAAQGPHAGDLPNLIAVGGGTARYEAASYRITLGSGPSSLFDADASALVIHAQPDDQVTDPAGNAGTRVVCGVIEKAPAN